MSHIWQDTPLLRLLTGRLNTVFIKKLPIAKLVTKFPASYRTWRCITAFNRPKVDHANKRLRCVHTQLMANFKLHQTFMSNYRISLNSALRMVITYRWFGTNYSPYFQGSRSLRLKILLRLLDNWSRDRLVVRQGQQQTTNLRSIKSLKKQISITSRRKPQITHRTRSFPFRLSIYV